MQRCVCLLTGLLFSFGLWAQSDANKGQIAGTVYDPNQAVVPGAKVTIKNTGTGAVREVKTGGAREFRAGLLDPGQYRATLEAQGFAPPHIHAPLFNARSAPPFPVPPQLVAH